jgi:hypothetical protein
VIDRERAIRKVDFDTLELRRNVGDQGLVSEMDLFEKGNAVLAWVCFHS